LQEKDGGKGKGKTIQVPFILIITVSLHGFFPFNYIALCKSILLSIDSFSLIFLLDLEKKKAYS